VQRVPTVQVEQKHLHVLQDIILVLEQLHALNVQLGILVLPLLKPFVLQVHIQVQVLRLVHLAQKDKPLPLDRLHAQYVLRVLIVLVEL
jgi:hypothetical protein